MGSKFGESPVVAIDLKAMHNGKVVDESEYEQKAWYDGVPIVNQSPSRVEDNSVKEGYQ